MSSTYVPNTWVETYEDNGLVTDWYIQSIGETFSDTGANVRYVPDCIHSGDPKRDLYFVSEAKSAALLVARGCKHLVYWAQGIAPEEDYLRFGSKARRFCS